MSSSKGHKSITALAIQFLLNDLEKNPLSRYIDLCGLLNRSSITSSSVLVDYKDIIALGHWMAYGQKHHFMRAKGQSNEDAYAVDVRYIYDNALDQCRILYRRMRLFWNRYNIYRDYSGTGYNGKIDITVEPPYIPFIFPRNEFRRQVCGGGRVDRGATICPVNWAPLGSALHALQDSFSPAHVERNKCGVIVNINIYDKENKKTHDSGDRDWEFLDSFDKEGHSQDLEGYVFRKVDDAFGKVSDLSQSGAAAMHASKALIVNVLRTAIEAFMVGHSPARILSWDDFSGKWLASDFSVIDGLV